jgi:hypothetical protein
LAFAGRRVRRPLRVAFARVVIIALGFAHGTFVSLDLLVGWARGGAPWAAAPGLALLAGDGLQAM